MIQSNVYGKTSPSWKKNIGILKNEYGLYYMYIDLNQMSRQLKVQNLRIT